MFKNALLKQVPSVLIKSALQKKVEIVRKHTECTWKCPLPSSDESVCFSSDRHWRVTVCDSECVQSVSNVLFQYFWLCHNIIGYSVHSDAFHSWVHRQNMYECHWESGMFSSCLSHLYHQSHNESLGSYSSWKQSVWLFGRLVVNTPFCSFPPLCSIRTGLDQALCQVGSAGQPEALQISQCLALAITHPPIS